MAGRKQAKTPTQGLIDFIAPHLENPVLMPSKGEVLELDDAIKRVRQEQPAGGWAGFHLDGQPISNEEALVRINAGTDRLRDREKIGADVQRFRHQALPSPDTLTPVLTADDNARRAERTQRARVVIERAQADLDARLSTAGITPDTATGTLAPLLTPADVAEILGSDEADVLKRAGHSFPAAVKTPAGPRFKVGPLAHLFRVI